jgi:poly(3-hydroxybutyrate) depolymerase
MPLPIRRAGALALLLAPALALATSTARLPASACYPVVDGLYGDGFEAPGAAAPGPSDPSHGTGGAGGNTSGTVSVAGYGTGTFYVHVPPGYDPARPWPVMVALHGTAGTHVAALSQAQSIRNDWTPIADAAGFIVIAPVSNHPQGGWYAPASAGSNQQDYGIIAGALLDVESHYNVERARVYGWGYSAGGHVMHDLAVNSFNATLNATTLAAYGVNAGVLRALACAGVSSATCGAFLAAMPRRVPVDIHIGDADSLLPYAQSDRVVFQTAGWVEGDDEHYTQFSGGHIWTGAQLGEIWNDVCTFAVAP